MEKYIIHIFIIIFLFISCSRSDKENEFPEKPEIFVTSPDKDFTFKLFTSNNSVSYKVFYKNKEIILKSQLGLQISGRIVLTGVKPDAIVNESVDQSWQPVYGEKNNYRDKYNEITVHFVSVEDEKPIVKLKMRAYNEGVAFRYEFENHVKTVIENELTEFTFPKDADIWVSGRAQSEIVKKKVSQLKNDIVERPLVAQLNDSLFLAIGEANLVDFARMKLKKNPVKPNGLVSSLEGEVVFNTSFKSPWRVIMAGKSAGELVENNFIFLNLSEPNKIASTDWIKPGKVIRDVTLTTKGGIACVDFAVKHNLQYVEFDAGWYGNEYDKKSDASKVNVDPKRSPGPLDLQRIINYADKKRIGIVLYVNQNALDTQIDKILPIYKKGGVKGVKYGFVTVGSQKATKWLHKAVKKAADNKLMVDIHDEYRPTGFSRTYPNLMTQEGIRGDEESPDNKHTLKTIFTRMIAGAADNTNCYFAERVEKMGSHVSQMAKSILIYSPWQFVYWYDRPENSPRKKGGAGNSAPIIKEIPDLQFYYELPTVWDDTKFLEGEIGKYATVARKSGDDWFVASMTDQSRALKITFDFLKKDWNYTATVYQDDDKLNTQTNVATKKIVINSGSVLNFELGDKNGLAIIIKESK